MCLKVVEIITSFDYNKNVTDMDSYLVTNISFIVDFETEEHEEAQSIEEIEGVNTKNQILSYNDKK